MQKNFKPEFKLMIENLREKLYKEKHKQSKSANNVPLLDGNFSVKNAPKRSAKHLEDKICKIKQIQIISLSLRIFLSQLKTFGKRVTLKITPLKLPYLKL